MNCHVHNSASAVATCSQGCGRGLCSTCANEWEPPSCAKCAQAFQHAAFSEQMDDIGELRKKMLINVVVLASAIIGTCIMLGVASSNDPGNAGASGTALFFYLPCIFWGWTSFRSLMESLSDATGMIFFIHLSEAGCWTLFFGAIFCAGFAPIIIPFQLFKQWSEYRELQGY